MTYAGDLSKIELPETMADFKLWLDELYKTPSPQYPGLTVNEAAHEWTRRKLASTHEVIMYTNGDVTRVDVHPKQIE